LQVPEFGQFHVFDVMYLVVNRQMLSNALWLFNPVDVGNVSGTDRLHFVVTTCSLQFPAPVGTLCANHPACVLWSPDFLWWNLHNDLWLYRRY